MDGWCGTYDPDDDEVDPDLEEMSLEDWLGKIEWEGGISEALVNYGLNAPRSHPDLQEKIVALRDAYREVEDAVDAMEQEAEERAEIDDDDLPEELDEGDADEVRTFRPMNF